MVALRRFSWLVLTLLSVQALEACISDTGGSDINPQPLPPGQTGEEGSSSGGGEDKSPHEPGAIGSDAGGGRNDDASDGGDASDAPHESTDGGDAG